MASPPMEDTLREQLNIFLPSLQAGCCVQGPRPATTAVGEENKMSRKNSKKKPPPGWFVRQVMKQVAKLVGNLLFFATVVMVLVFLPPTLMMAGFPL